MISWNVSAQFYRHINLANVKIPLHSFLKDFRILESKIENDMLVLGFAHKDHFLCNSLMILKPVCKEVVVLK